MSEMHDGISPDDRNAMNSARAVLLRDRAWVCPACGTENPGTHERRSNLIIACSSCGQAVNPVVGPVGVNTTSMWSFEGRASRWTFWCTIVSLAIVRTVIVRLLIQDWGAGHRSLLASLIGLGVDCVLLWFLFAVQVKRWHDLDFSGLLAPLTFSPLLLVLFAAAGGSGREILLALLVPFVVAQLVTLGILGFMPGTKGPNKYGDPPFSTAALPAGDPAMPNEPADTENEIESPATPGEK